MNIVLSALMGGVLVVTAGTAAEAAFDWQYVDSRDFLTNPPDTSEANVTDLGEVKEDTSRPTLGPTGEGSSFSVGGQRVNLVGALNSGQDGYRVAFESSVPSLKFVLNELIFYGDNPGNNIDGDGTFEMRIESDVSAEDDLTFTWDETVSDLPIGVAYFGGITGLVLDNTENRNLIEYDIDIVATPLPGALVLFGTGLAGIAGYRRWVKPAA